jgi:hypothetical protein
LIKAYINAKEYKLIMLVIKENLFADAKENGSKIIINKKLKKII